MLARDTENITAFKTLKIGQKAAGWTLVRLVPAGPWGFCLIKKGDTVARCSPQSFKLAADR